jgi:hypothetical protein
LESLVTDALDPVVERRARIARAVTIAQRIGYLALIMAVITFVAAFVSGFPSWLVAITIGALVAAIVILPVPIIFGYGVRAAEREERGGGSFH